MKHTYKDCICKLDSLKKFSVEFVQDNDIEF